MHFEIRSSTTRSARALSAAAALFAASTAFAGNPQGPNFDVSIQFEVSTIMFTPDYSAPYITFSLPNVEGFTDPSDPGNYVTVSSMNGSFDGTTDATGTGSTSTNFDSADSLKNDLTGDWRILINDGATRTSYSYIFSLDAGNLDPEFLRRINITSPTDGSVFNDSPTFEWFLDPTDNPDTDFDFAQAFLIDSSSNFYGEPALNPNDTSWTSNQNLPIDDYTFYMYMQNYDLDSDMFSSTFPVPEDRGNGATINSFNISLTAGAYAFVNDLTILPAPGTIALAGGLGFIALRRRR